MRRALWVLLALGACLALGLWGWRKRPTPPPKGLERVAPLCVQAAQVFCDKLVACGGMDQAQAPTCIARRSRDCDLDVGWRMRARPTPPDGEPVSECLEGMEGADCNAVAFVLGDDEQNFFELTDRCEVEELVAWDAGFGAPCLTRWDCGAGFCPYAEAGCHTCRPFAAPGEPCAPGQRECDPTSFCDADQCVARRARDEACRAATECADAVCRRTLDGGRVCGALPLGGRCKDGRDCGGGAFCRHAGGAGACAPKVKKGEACLPDRESPCADAEAACIQGRCRVRPFSVAIGEACRAFTDCKDGAYCRWASAPGEDGVCTAQSQEGGPCRPLDFGTCPVGLRCVNGACRRLGSQGQRCAAAYLCKAELDCADGVCLPAAPLGSGCGPDHACAEGFCDAGTCVPGLPDGIACQSDHQCASGRCAQRTCAPLCLR